MDKLPKIEDKENVFIRALFTVEIFYSNRNEFEIEDNTISILCSPNLNHFKRIKAEPFQYYFHNESLVMHTQSENNSHMDYKIFALDKIDETDNQGNLASVFLNENIDAAEDFIKFLDDFICS